MSTMINLYVVGCICLVSGIAARDVEDRKTEDSTLVVVFLGLLTVLTLTVLLLLCAGDSKTVKHNDPEINHKNNQNFSTPSRNDQSTFQEIQLSKQRDETNSHQIAKPISPIQNKRKDLSPQNSSLSQSIVTPISYETSETNKDKNEMMFVSYNNGIGNNAPSTSRHDRNGHFDKMSFDNSTRHTETNRNRGSNMINEPSTSDARTGSATEHTTESSNNQVPLHSGLNHDRLADGARNDNNSRQNREDTGDDFGYHSDYSKSFKPSDSSRINTQRSSQPSLHPRSSTSNDVDEDVIETYCDDGESIDWN